MDLFFIDMVFGVPLETLLRAHPGDGIPAVLYKCVRAVEARGKLLDYNLLDVCRKLMRQLFRTG